MNRGVPGPRGRSCTPRIRHFYLMALSRRSLAILPRDQSRANDYSNGFAIQGVVAGVRKRKRPRMNRHMRNTPQTSIRMTRLVTNLGQGRQTVEDVLRISFISKQLSL